jgi:hypothetical protein
LRLALEEIYALLERPIDETRELFSSFLQKMVSRGYPMVLLEEEGVPVAGLVALLEGNEEIFKELGLGIQSLDGSVVVEYGLIDELEGTESSDSWGYGLYFDVLHIAAAKLGMVVLEERDRRHDHEGLSSLKESILVPVEELLLKDVDEHLIATYDHYANQPYRGYVIRRTARVEAFLAEHEEYFGLAEVGPKGYQLRKGYLL